MCRRQRRPIPWPAWGLRSAGDAFAAFMQARSSCQPTHLSSYNPQRRPGAHLRLSPPRRAPPPAPSSPLARTTVDGWPKVSNARVLRRSVCDLIPEEAHGLSSDLSATHIDLSLELLKRHHKPRTTPNRTASDPQILSTITTQPIHIPKSPCVSLSPSPVVSHRLPARWPL